MRARTHPPPLARLFALAYRSLIDDLHEELRAQGWDDVRPAFGFVLLALRDTAHTPTSLASLLGTTKQATSKLIDSMEGAGYVHRIDAPDGRQRPMELTGRGHDLLDAVEGIYVTLERRWARAIGRTELERLRHDLMTVLDVSDDGRLPPVRPV